MRREGSGVPVAGDDGANLLRLMAFAETRILSCTISVRPRGRSARDGSTACLFDPVLIGGRRPDRTARVGMGLPSRPLVLHRYAALFGTCASQAGG
jgi:hypothetical protein